MADVLLFPPAELSSRVTSRSGTYTVQVTVTGSGPYPMKGGGQYTPGTVFLVWDTADGVTWMFREAILVGPRTADPHQFGPASQTIYLGDPTYPGTEPAWLAALVSRHAPGKASA